MDRWYFILFPTEIAKCCDGWIIFASAASALKSKIAFPPFFPHSTIYHPLFQLLYGTIGTGLGVNAGSGTGNTL